jgi:hypothetical protein
MKSRVFSKILADKDVVVINVVAKTSIWFAITSMFPEAVRELSRSTRELFESLPIRIAAGGTMKFMAFPVPKFAMKVLVFLFEFCSKLEKGSTTKLPEMFRSKFSPLCIKSARMIMPPGEEIEMPS